MRRAPLLLAVLVALLAHVPAQAQDPTLVTETFHVPTVDGAKVWVEVTRPDVKTKVPVILTYSPYNVLGASSNDGLGAKFFAKGYARAIADLLGVRNSSGCWDYGGLKEQQSGVDLVNALAAQPWSNGKVAMMGGSYDGTTANMVAARGADAPGLAAIVPEAAISRWYGYAFSHGIRYIANSEDPSSEGADTPAAFDFGLTRVPPNDPASAEALAAHAQPCGADEHTAQGYSRQPDYGPFWLERDYLKDASKVRVPVLVYHGWQDYNVKQEEGLNFYNALDKAPWKGLWVRQAGHSGLPAEADPLLSAFFDAFLKGERAALDKLPRVYSQPREHATDGQTQPLDSWPPPRTGDVELRLGRGASGGTLGAGGGEPASYVDSGTGTEESAASDPGAETQWLTYVSEPLSADIRIAGAPALELSVSVDRANGDLVPTLFAVDEAGAYRPITRGFLDLRYREGLTAAKPVPTGTPLRVPVSFWPQDWIVRKGQRLALVVASSNVAWAEPDAPGLGVTVNHDASRLLIPVVGAGPAPAGAPAPSIPGGTRPTNPLPSRLDAQRSLRVKARALSRRRLRITGRAPAGVRVALAVRLGKRTVARRTVRARNGRFAITLRVRSRGRYRVSASVRTREGLVTRQARPVRLRSR